MAETSLRIRLSATGAGEVSSAFDGILSTALKMKGAIAGLAASVGSLAAFGAAVRKSVEVNAELERQATAFKTLLGSAEAAQRRIGELSKFAAQTPFELPEVVQASKTLQSLTNGALASGDALRIVGDAAAASGRPLDEVSMWIGRLYAGLQSGTPVGEATLRLVEMGLVSGTTARKLNDLAETGSVAGNAFETIRDTFGKFSGAMADQAKTFSGLWSTLKDTANMALADIGKPLFDGLKSALQAAIPFVEEFGAKVAAFVQVAIDAWKTGRFGELLGLTIEAGFEIGIEAAGKMFQRLVDFLGTGSMWSAIGNALLTSINEAMKAVGGLVVDYLLVPLGAVATWTKDAFSYAFESVVDFFAADLEKVINAAADLLNNAFGTSIGKVSLTGTKAFSAPDFAAAFAENAAGGQVLKETIDGFFNNSTQAFRSLTGIGSSLSVGSTARDSLSQLIEQQRAAMAAAKAAAAAGPNPTPAVDPKIVNARLEAQRLELQVSQALAGINRSRSAVESSWLLTSVEKFQQRKRLLEEERTILEAQADALTRLAAVAQEKDRLELEKQAQTARGRADQVGGQIWAMGPDPMSFRDQFASTFRDLAQEAAITAQSVAQTFADVFRNAVQSISSGITGLIMGTQTWGQALAAIGTSILTSLVGAIVQMGVRWIATQILMATVGKSIMAASLAASAPIAAAQAAIWATPATLATIASYGAAASAAPGFIAASQAIVMAQSVAGFRSGGYTGDGSPDAVAGIVHRGEFVMPADAVDRIGLETLEAMKAGDSAPSGTTSSTAPAPITVNMGIFDDPRRLTEWARSSEGRTVLVDVMRQHAHEFIRE